MNTDSQKDRMATLVQNLESRTTQVRRAIEAFRNGKGVMIGDDGARENEVDYVFHAQAATAEHVNFAISHCKGLLCVSIGQRLADTLGFMAAPRNPGLFSHTGFTVSIDAREGITSGISAHDRAVTMRKIVEAGSKNTDFVSPGHVFPVRAEENGLLARTGHTEAVLDLCRLAGLAEAAAMCEVLGPDGEALPVGNLQNNYTSKIGEKSNFDFVSTVDLFWYRLLIQQNNGLGFGMVQFGFSEFKPLRAEEASRSMFFETQHKNLNNGQNFKQVSQLIPGVLQALLLPCALHVKETASFPELAVGLERLPRIQILDGNSIYESEISVESCTAQLTLFCASDIEAELPENLALFCDLSAKEGIHATAQSVKRSLTLLYALEAVFSLSHPNVTSGHRDSSVQKTQWITKILATLNSAVFAGDKAFLGAVLRLRHELS